MQKIQRFFFFLFLTFFMPLKAQKTFVDPVVGSAFVTASGENKAFPIAMLSEKLGLSFDVFDLNLNQVYYSFTYYNADWTESSAFVSEYLKGPGKIYFNDFQTSKQFNGESYNHFEIQFPNPEVSFLRSGNYSVEVYQAAGRKKLLSLPFVLVENQTQIQAKIHRSALFPDTNQSVEITVNSSGYPIVDPQYKTQVKVCQNYKFTDCITLNKPTLLKKDAWYFNPNAFDFRSDPAYYALDTKIRNMPGFTTEAVDINGVETQVYLNPVPLFSSKNFVRFEDINGGFLLRTLDFISSTDPSDTAEYQRVHFSLFSPQQYEEPLYVLGAFNAFQPQGQSPMAYDESSKTYKTSILLKQGYYNYQFYHLDKNGKPNAINPSFWQQENVYHVFVYGKSPTQRYDQLVGYGQFSSID